MMSSLRPLYAAFPIERQLALDVSPVILVNLITVDSDDEQAFLQAWQEDASLMKQQSGFISTQLHRAIGDSPVYLNYAEWESTAHFRTAIAHPEFRANRHKHPTSVVATPHLFERVAVPGVCAA